MLIVVYVIVQLDHTVSVESLEKMTIYFRQLYNVFLAQEKPDCPSLLANHIRTLMAATNCLTVDVAALKFSMQVLILYSVSMLYSETGRNKVFPSHMVALISISLALSQTQVYTARPQIWG